MGWVILLAVIAVLAGRSLRRRPDQPREPPGEQPRAQTWPSGAPMSPPVPTSAATGGGQPTGSMDSSMDSTIEMNSLREVADGAEAPPEPARPMAAGAPGPKVVPLPGDLEVRVMEFMRQGHEVGAVRLLCDELDIGIIDARHTARTLAGLATP